MQLYFVPCCCDKTLVKGTSCTNGFLQVTASDRSFIGGSSQWQKLKGSGHITSVTENSHHIYNWKFRAQIAWMPANAQPTFSAHSVQKTLPSKWSHQSGENFPASICVTKIIPPDLPGLDNPSLKLSSHVILYYVKSTIKTSIKYDREKS